MIVTTVLAAALLAGCGGSSSTSSTSGGSTSGAGAAKAKGSSTGTAPAGASAKACALDAAGTAGLRVTGVSCGKGQKVVLAWRRGPGCELAAGASRGGCKASGYTCEMTATERGVAVSCARPGRSIAFTAKD